jgi:hypothetical protein
MLLPVSAVRTVCTDNNYNTHPAHACSPRFTHPISFMIRTVFITLVYIYTHDRPTSRCPDACTTLFLTQPAEHSARSQSVCVSSFVSQPGHRSPHCPPAVRTMLSTPPSTDNRYTPSGVSLTQPTVTHVPHHHGTLPYGTVRRDEGIDYTTQVPYVALHTLLDRRTTTREFIIPSSSRRDVVLPSWVLSHTAAFLLVLSTRLSASRPGGGCGELRAGRTSFLESFLHGYSVRVCVRALPLLAVPVCVFQTVGCGCGQE